MKNLIRKIMVAVCFSAAIALAFGMAKDVSAKSKITYKFKKGTLTIKGKGDIPKKKTFKNNKKIKKVVIKKGIKSIPNNAFKKCVKLKKVTIPSSVKKIGTYAFSGTGLKKLTIPKSVKQIGDGFVDNCKSLDALTIPGDFTKVNEDGNEAGYYPIDKTYLIQVKFNSNLNYKNCGYFKTLNLQVSKNDKEFKSIDGVVYTKDGSAIVRVPSERTSLTIANGCQTVYTAALSYEYGSNGAVSKLANVTIPASVTKITNEKYNVDAFVPNSQKINFKIMDQSKLSIDDFVKLKNAFRIKPAKLANMLPERIKFDEEYKVYVGDNKYLVSAGGDHIVFPEGVEIVCEEAFKGFNEASDVTVNVPEGIKEIRDNAFSGAYFRKITLPESLVLIGKGAFSETQGLEEVTIPKNINVVNDDVFYNSYSLKKVDFEGKITSYGKRAFAYTKVNVNELLKVDGLKSIGNRAFDNVEFKNITIPATIETIGTNAFQFSYDGTQYVTFEGSTNNYDPSMFVKYYYENGNLSFTQGIKDAFTGFDVARRVKSKKKYKISLGWIKVSDATGYEIRLSKDAAGKKGVKKIFAKYNENSAEITDKKSDKHKYAMIRPYKLENGKNVYGKWTVQEMK